MATRLIPRFTAEQLDCLSTVKAQDGTPQVWERGRQVASRSVGDRYEMVFWDKSTCQVTVVQWCDDPDEGWRLRVIEELCYTAPIGFLQALDEMLQQPLYQQELDSADVEAVLIVFTNWMSVMTEAISAIKDVPGDDVWDAIQGVCDLLSGKEADEPTGEVD